jgi:putative transposase
VQEVTESLGGRDLWRGELDELGQRSKYRIVLTTVLRTEKQKGFSVLPRRWVVERTLAWLSQSRRLSKDYEELPTTSETFIYVAMTRLMLRRLAA